MPVVWYLVLTDYNSDCSSMVNFRSSQTKRLACSSSLTCALSPVALPESYCPAAPKNCPLTHLQYCHNKHSSEFTFPMLKEQPLLTGPPYLGKEKRCHIHKKWCVLEATNASS